MNEGENQGHPLSLAGTAGTEAAFLELAGQVARGWRERGPGVLVAGLEGPLGAGKTTWVRGMLRGLGYAHRVPSPTYTLLERYELEDLTILHLDLYRLSGSEEELEALGVREWLAGERVWALAEWPERSPRLRSRCDVRIGLTFLGPARRGILLEARSAAGEAALRGLEASIFPDSS